MSRPQGTLELKGVVFGCACVAPVVGASADAGTGAELGVGRDPVCGEQSGRHHGTSGDRCAAGDIKSEIGALQHSAALSVDGYGDRS